MSEDHEVTATYAGGPGKVYYQPSFSCLCGFFAREETWEEAGAAYDTHLEESE